MSFISRSSRMTSNYKRKYTISQHALERFRERVDDEYTCRDDHDLMNLLDEKLRGARQKWDVRDPRAPTHVTKLYEISTRKVGVFYAVVRDETAVTVLDKDMAANNFAGQWAPILNLPFEGLRDFVLPSKPPVAVAAAALVEATVETPPVVIEPLQIAEETFAAAWARKEAAVAAVEAADRELVEARDALEAATRDLAILLTGRSGDRSR
jgi:hypothetical protein